jgi:hypothetical protein
VAGQAALDRVGLVHDLAALAKANDSIEAASSGWRSNRRGAALAVPEKRG